MLDVSDNNHGWVVIGAESGGQSSRRFDTREHPDPASRPMLVIEFTPPVVCAGAWTVAGDGLGGAGGAVPALSGSGCPEIGGCIVLKLANAVGGASGLLFVGLQRSCTHLPAQLRSAPRLSRVVKR